MVADIHCPKCPSVNVIFSKKRSVYVCEDCCHEFTPDKTFIPQRIFLSYGHDEHVSLAIHLRDDLRNRGHTVWFDEERLQPGHDWEAFIEKGLEHLAADKANAAVILLLTPHSVRRPDGYCLNEVARALGRGLRIIPLMVVDSEPPLSICRIQWLDMRQCLPLHEKKIFYEPRFDRLLKALEEKQLDFEGAQQRLLKALQPLEFDADMLRHLPKFTGRQWVFDAIDQWLAESPPKQRVFWISGGPGVGKTAISAVLSSRYREVAALHLCKFGHAQKSDPRCVVTSVVYQLITQLPEYEARLASMDVERLAQDDARTMFDNLLVQPLAKLTPPTRSVVILIDALDEATRDGRNELASFIAMEFPKTPAWLRLIITSRPEAEVTAPLQGMNLFILDTDIESNRADIRDYLRRELASHLKNRPNVEHLIEQVLAKSEGLFLYVERVCDDIQHGNLSLEHLDQFPQGLGGVYWQFFERKFSDQAQFNKDIRPALRAILAAREPLPVETLQRLFNWQDEELRDFTRTLGSLFPITTESGHQVIKPYHKSLADWLMDEARACAYFVSIREGHRMLAEFGWRECHGDIVAMSLYSMRHVPQHLVSAERYNDFCSLLEMRKYILRLRDDENMVDLLRLCCNLISEKTILTPDLLNEVALWTKNTPEMVFGELLHARYKQNSMSRLPDNLRPWNRLRDEIRVEAVVQIQSIIRILWDCNFCVKKLDGATDDPILLFCNTELESLAEKEHDRWCRERLGNGWIYGPTRDNFSKVHNCIVPWSELSEDYRKYDRAECRRWLTSLSELGYGIFRLYKTGYHRMGDPNCSILDCTALLADSSFLDACAMKWHQNYVSSVIRRFVRDDPQSWVAQFATWNELPLCWKERFWHQVADIFRILKGSSFRILPASNDLGKERIVLANDEVERLAEKEHDRWCRERLADGWVYAPKRDDTKKMHNFIVPWSELPDGEDGVKKYDREEVRSWPEIFARGGYEIFRSDLS